MMASDALAPGSARTARAASERHCAAHLALKMGARGLFAVRRSKRLVFALIGALALAAVVLAGALAPAAAATVSSGGLSRRELFVGLLCLGIFGVVAVGFDIRDWF